MNPPTQRSSLSLTLAILTWSLILACARTEQKQVTAREGLSRREFHVLIVVLDACRADKMGCYGFDRPTTPVLDALAAGPDSVVFRNHSVQGSWTKPSTASLFSGLYVHQHGVLMGHMGRQSASGRVAPEYSTQILPETHETLAERMRALGYRTFGVVTSGHLEPKYGFAQGFDDFATSAEVRGGDRGRIRHFLELARRSPGKVFGYLHINACHHPFPPGAREREYMERFAVPYDEQARQAAGVNFTTPEMGKAIRGKGTRLLPEDVRFLNLIYEAQLRGVDKRQVAGLLTGLREAGLYDDTLLIVTADHGEELYDHQGYDHGHTVFQESVHVPMIVKFPRGRRPAVLGTEVSSITRAIDVLPALLDFAGAPVPPGLPGVPIFRGVFAEASISQAEKSWALMEGEYKLVVAAGTPMLFHLTTDPRELKDLAAVEPERMRRMKAKLEALLLQGARNAPIINDRLTPEAEANLRALGYLH